MTHRFFRRTFSATATALVAWLAMGVFGVLVGALGSAPARAEDAGNVVLAVGEARIGSAAAKGGSTVQTGERITTGANGYVYIKTVDNGFLILRPQTAARIVAYHVDPQNPANSKFKFELEQGVARSISGTAVKSARQNFRFNTPVAAIGVRGTDFTVFTDQQVTRIQVVSGGIAASGFNDGCTPEGGGPCEGSTVRELFATQSGQMLLISRQQPTPQVLRGNGLAPDSVAPPRGDEPAGKSAGSADAGALRDPNLVPLKLAGIEKTTPQAVPQLPPGPPAFIWGRWQTVADQPGDVDIKKTPAAYGVAAINSYYILLRNKEATWQAPNGGVANFALQGAQAGVRVGSSVDLQAASIENGRLAVDFNTGSFTTQLDLLTQGERLQRVAQGGVGSDGTFSNPSQFLGSSMVVQGQLANAANGGLNAAYLFQSRLDDNRVAYGVTYWAK